MCLTVWANQLTALSWANCVQGQVVLPLDSRSSMLVAVANLGFSAGAIISFHSTALQGAVGFVEIL